MRFFPFHEVSDNLRLPILTKILIEDSLTLLEVNRELRHFILERGPLYRKRFKKLQIMISRVGFTDDSVITDDFSIMGREIGAEDESSLVCLDNGDADSSHHSLMDVEETERFIKYFCNAVKRVAFCCEDLRIDLSKEERDDQDTPDTILIPLIRLSTAISVVRSFNLHDFSGYETAEIRVIDFDANYAFLQRFHPLVLESFNVYPGICNEVMLAANRDVEVRDILENMLHHCTLINMTAEERLIPRILPKLLDLRSLIVECSRADFLEKAANLIEKPSYHHLAEVCLVCYVGIDERLFDDLTARLLRIEPVTKEVLPRSFHSLIDHFTKLQAALDSFGLIDDLDDREETMILVKKRPDQDRSFILKRCSPRTCYFYTIFE